MNNASKFSEINLINYIDTYNIVKIINVTFYYAGLWQGLGPRIVMVGTLTAAQWFIYDGVKVAFRLPRPPPPEMPESLKNKLAAQ